MNYYTKLARETIENYLKLGKAIQPSFDLPNELLNQQAGVFVSIHKKQELRGCIGTFLPIQKNIAQEIISNAISAAVADPRFSPITTDELPSLDISVDVLNQPEQISSIAQLDPKKYGVIVKTKDGRAGLLLPDLEGVDNVEKQLSIACQKAGIDPSTDKIFLYRFSVVRYLEI